MSKAIKKPILPLNLAVAAAMMGGESYYGQSEPKEHKPFVSRGMPIPRPKSEDEKRRTKEHRAKLKARRNARKGIYEHKISYKKKRSKMKCQ